MRLLDFSEITLQVSALVLLIIIVRKLFGEKLNPNIRYFLWFFVAIRILFPIHVEMSMEVPKVWSDSALGNVLAEEVHIQNIPVQNATWEQQILYDEKIEPMVPTPTVNDMVSEFNPEPKVFHMEEHLIRIWLVGAFVFALYIVLNNIKLLTALKGKRRFYKTLPNGLTVYSMKGYNCLVGIFKPAIYVDTEQISNDVVIENVIRHELQHYQVRDNIWQLVRVICIILQWYNPLAWCAYWMSKKDCELACDYRTVQDMTGEERYLYGDSLLAISVSLSKNQKMSIATSMGDNKKFIEARIRTIMQSKYKNAVIFTIVTVGLICLVSLVCVITVKFLPKEVTESEEGETENELENQIWELEEMMSRENEEINKILEKVAEEKSWSKDSVIEALIIRFKEHSPGVKPRIIDCVLVDDGYMDLAGVVLFVASDPRIANGEELARLGYLNVKGEVIDTGHQHTLSAEPEFTYLGDGTVSYKHIHGDDEQRVATCGYELGEDGNGVVFTMKTHPEVGLYELETITEPRYEHNGSYIEFEDMPQTDVETIACLERLYQITGEKYKFADFWHRNALSHSGYDDLQPEDNADKSSIYEYIIIKDVHEMSFPELTNLESTKLIWLFDSMRQEYMPDMRLDSYVRMILRNNCKVVSIEFDSKYKEDAVIGDPHVGDGTGNVVHWLFVPDTNGQMRAWDWDAVYGRFDMHSYVKDDSEIPEEFKAVIVPEGIGGRSAKTDWTKEEVKRQFKVKNAPKGWTLIDCQVVDDLYNSYIGVALYKNEQEEIKLAFMSASGNTSAEWSNVSLTAETKFTYGGGGRISYSFINEAGKECSYDLYYRKTDGVGYEWLETYLEPYDLPMITETRYEHNGSYIEFEDMPETDAETIVSLYKLYGITCDGYNSSKYAHSQTGNCFMPIETEPVDISEHRSGYEWIKVHDVQEMTFEELSKIDIYEDVFKSLKINFAKNDTLDNYVQMILNNGCKVVYIHYTDKYYDDVLAGGPQWDHGEKKVYFLLVPEVNGQLKLYASSFNYLVFNTHLFAQRQGYAVPEELQKPVF